MPSSTPTQPVPRAPTRTRPPPTTTITETIEFRSVGGDDRAEPAAVQCLGLGVPPASCRRGSRRVHFSGRTPREREDQGRMSYRSAPHPDSWPTRLPDWV